jgi:hypothetical protein
MKRVNNILFAVILGNPGNIEADGRGARNELSKDKRYIVVLVVVVVASIQAAVSAGGRRHV